MGNLAARKMAKATVHPFLFLAPILFLAGCVGNPGPLVPNSSLSGSEPTALDCSYQIEADKLIAVEIDGAKPIYKDPSWYGDKEATTFVLIKRDAGIPAWKVRSGYGGGEMDEIGVTTGDYPENPDSGGKRVFIGIGHCQGKPGDTCLDPLPQSLLFVLQTEGATSPPFPKKEEEPGFWWTFNVYFDTAAFEGDQGWRDENLPWWIRECVGGDVRKGGGAGAAIFAADEPEPPLFIAKASITPLDPPSLHWEDSVSSSYRLDKKVNPYPPESLEEVGYFLDGEETFTVFYTLAPEGWLHLILAGEEGPVFQYEVVHGNVPSGKNSLQLGTFNPVKNFVYEWWTPSCKPVVYFYPQVPTRFSVSLRPWGLITKSDPPYPRFSGWEDILALPSGKLIYQGEEYPSLFYEGIIISLKIPEKGWMMRKKDLSSFFDWLLPKLGLNQKEQVDFKEYWLSRLEKDLYFVTFLPREEIDRVEPMKVSVLPETFIRTRLFFKALTVPKLVSPPTLPEKPGREGFTIVDWGGFYRE